MIDSELILDDGCRKADAVYSTAAGDDFDDMFRHWQTAVNPNFEVTHHWRGMNKQTWRLKGLVKPAVDSNADESYTVYTTSGTLVFSTFSCSCVFVVTRRYVYFYFRYLIKVCDSLLQEVIVVR